MELYAEDKHSSLFLRDVSEEKHDFNMINARCHTHLTFFNFIIFLASLIIACLLQVGLESTQVKHHSEDRLLALH